MKVGDIVRTTYSAKTQIGKVERIVIDCVDSPTPQFCVRIGTSGLWFQKHMIEDATPEESMLYLLENA